MQGSGIGIEIEFGAVDNCRFCGKHGDGALLAIGISAQDGTYAVAYGSSIGGSFNLRGYSCRCLRFDIACRFIAAYDTATGRIEDFHYAADYRRGIGVVEHGGKHSGAVALAQEARQIGLHHNRL